MVIILVAIYTLALCIGTIAGNMISQGFFSVAILGFPFILPTLIAGAISIHTVGLTSNHTVYTEEKCRSLRFRNRKSEYFSASSRIQY